MKLVKNYVLKYLSLLAKRRIYKHFYNWKNSIIQKKSELFQLPLMQRSAIHSPFILSPVGEMINSISPSANMSSKNVLHKSAKSSMISFKKNSKGSKALGKHNTELFNEIKSSLLKKVSSGSLLKTIIETKHLPKKGKNNQEKNKNIKHNRTITIDDVAVVSSKVIRNSDIGFKII